MTVVWGVILTAVALVAGSIEKTVIEAINKVGSAFYGPVLVTFLLGLGRPRIGGRAISVGVVLGVSVNLTFWIFSAPLHWMWWNVIGALVTWIVAEMIGGGSSEHSGKLKVLWNGQAVALLLGVFLLTLLLVIGLSLGS